MRQTDYSLTFEDGNMQLYHNKEYLDTIIGVSTVKEAEEYVKEWVSRPIIKKIAPRSARFYVYEFE